MAADVSIHVDNLADVDNDVVGDVANTDDVDNDVWLLMWHTGFLGLHGPLVNGSNLELATLIGHFFSPYTSQQEKPIYQNDQFSPQDLSTNLTRIINSIT